MCDSVGSESTLASQAIRSAAWNGFLPLDMTAKRKQWNLHTRPSSKDWGKNQRFRRRALGQALGERQANLCMVGAARHS